MTGEPPRVAIIGVGHVLCGDDAVGLHVVNDLAARFSGVPNLYVFSAGSSPENCTGALRGFSPDLVLIVDAANLGSAPGTVNWINWRSIDDVGLSTHNYPLSLLAAYLESQMPCEVVFLGIQPLDTSLGTWMSSHVQDAVQSVTHDIQTLFTEMGMCS